MSRFAVTTSLLILLIAGALLAGPTQVNGRIETIGGVRVLRVWGTPEEMGFAHGFLAGKDYLAPPLKYHSSPGLSAAIDGLRNKVRVARFPERVRTEIDAIFRGIIAAARKTPIVEGVGRPLTIEDLYVDNAFDMLRAFHGACSGFTLWGDKAGDLGLIAARNFDFHVSGPEALGKQLILVRHPAGRHAVASVTWPGIIGVFTGVNELGVCAFVHDGSGRVIRNLSGTYTPLLSTLTDFLETARPGDAHSRVQALLRGIAPYPFSYMVRVIVPRGDGFAGRPVRVFRVDGDGMGENAADSKRCITTNHYVDEGVDAAGEDDWSASRYRKLANLLEGVLTREGAWRALREVTEPGGHTLHALIAYPEKREIDLAMASWESSIKPATASTPTVISFDKIFDKAGTRTGVQDK